MCYNITQNRLLERTIVGAGGGVSDAFPGWGYGFFWPQRVLSLTPPWTNFEYAPGGYPYDPAVNVSLVSVNRSVARTGGSLKVQVSLWRNTGYYNLSVHINTSINSCKIDNILIKPPSLLRP